MARPSAESFVAFWVLMFLLWSPLGFSGEPAGVVMGSRVKVTATVFKLDRKSGHYSAKAKITNKSKPRQPIFGPLTLVVTGTTPSGIVLANADGKTADDLPYIVLQLPAAGLKPGKAITNIPLRFTSLGSAKIKARYTVYGLLAPNHAPVANAGPSRTLFVGDTATPDGSASIDADGDALTYHWTLIGKPSASMAGLTVQEGLQSGFTLDLPGTYQVQLVVNDRVVDSAPDVVTISTENSRPVADAGSDQTAPVGATVTLDGGGSHDIDHDPLTYLWSLTGKPANSAAELIAGNTLHPSFSLDQPGHYEAGLVVNDGKLDSVPDTVAIDTRNSPPVARIILPNPPTATVNLPYALDGRNSSDPDGDLPLAYTWSLLSPLGHAAELVPDSITPALAQLTPLTADTYVIQLIANDHQVNSAPVTAAITVKAGQPQAVVPALANLSYTAAGLEIQKAGLVIGQESFQFDATLPKDAVLGQNPPAGSGVASGTAVDLTISLGQPPNPDSTAPAVDATVAATLADSTRFLFDGSSPIQRLSSGAALDAGTIQVKRAAVIRGKVLDSNNLPLPGVVVGILNHPEFGHTLSRADGLFDFAANGGGQLTLDYRKTGYLPVQRQVNAAWQNFAWADDAIMMARDATVTPVDFTVPIPMQAVRGSAVSDAAGIRRPTVLIPQGTEARIYNPDGTTQVRSSLNLRFTEYTVGPNGSAAMPAPLPPTSAYTYAVELGADEAVTKIAGKDVLFSQPVYFYLENFLDFPAGIQVPVGYYAKDKGVWLPSPDGRVIAVKSIAGGLAELDTDGDGNVDNGAAIGVTDAERKQLAGLYSAGQTLERIPIDHFSTYDPNYGASPVPGAKPPEQPKASDEDKDKPDDACAAKGSIIECESQVLGETLDLTGSDFTLNYRGDRVPGRRTANTLKIPLSGATLPAPLQSIELQIQVAGRVFSASFAPQPNLVHTFTWDGKDAYGRDVMGTQPVSIRIGYAYPGYYNLPPSVAASFGLNSGQPIPGNRPTRAPVILWQQQSASVGMWDARGQGLMGWTLSAHHSYDPVGQILHLGTGERRSALSLRINAINPVAGKATPAGYGGGGFSGDGGPAADALFKFPSVVAVAPDGSLYITDEYNHRIRRVGTDGIVTTVAGNGTAGYGGDGGPATAASLNYPGGIAVVSDGSFYFTDWHNHRVRRVGTDGIVTTVAGTGGYGSSGDGGPATQATLQDPWSVALGPDGSLYIADQSVPRLRRIGPDGVINTVAGGGTPASGNGDGGPATLASMTGASFVAVAPDGRVFFADYGGRRIRRIGSDGNIDTVAGGGALANGNGDGGPAILASLGSPSGISIAPDGGFYLADWTSQRIQRVGPDGIINTVAGSGAIGASGDGGPATQAQLYDPWTVAVAPDGGFYVADYFNHRIRKVTPPLPGFDGGDIAVASDDGSEIYQFNAAGRHLKTLNTLTGAVRLDFGYDAAGRLMNITDGDGNITAIERDATGNPVAIIAPFGQRTLLAADANGFLASLTDPTGAAYQLAYSNDGLLQTFTDPNGHASTLTYDSLGRLLKDQDAAGGSQNLSRTDTNAGYEVALTTALQRITVHKVGSTSIGELRRSTVLPAGTQTETQTDRDGGVRTLFEDGSVNQLTESADPRFGMQAPFASINTLTTGGFSRIITTERSASLPDPNNPLVLTSLTDTINTNGRNSTLAYEAATKTFTGTSPAGRVTIQSIDNQGRPTQSQVAGLVPVTRSYDARGRLASIIQGTAPETRTVSFTYDPQGNVATVTDPVGRSTDYKYDAAGRLIQQTLPDGRGILYGYDAKGNLTSLTPPGRPAHGFDYTAVDLRGRYTPPGLAGAGDTLYDYDLDKSTARITRPDGQALAFGYDSAGRMNKLSILALPSGSEDIGFAYDALTGKLSTITTADGGTLTYTYNGAMTTQAQWAGTVGGNVSRVYNNDFQVTEIKVNGADPIAYQYDADNLPIQAGALALSHDPRNGLLTGGSLGRVNDSLTYNGFGEVSNYTARIDGNSIFATEFVRDKLSRITKETETTAAATHIHEYSYDLAGRLSEVKRDGSITASYTYDDNGNRLTVPGNPVAASYDIQDRLSQFGGATYAYTANGEIKSKTVGPAVTQYHYDALGNLRDVTLPSGVFIEYLVDGQGRRIGKKIGGALVQGFLYQDALKPIAELDGQGGVVSRFVYATHTNVPDYMIRGGQSYRLIADHLGSPRLVVNTTDGSIVQRMDYDEWGRVLPSSFTSPGFEQPFGYAGGLYDADTGLVRFGARDYDAETGRWTAKDPAGMASGTNLYEYAAGNPVNIYDPNGMGWIFRTPEPLPDAQMDNEEAAEFSKILDEYKAYTNKNGGKPCTDASWAIAKNLRKLNLRRFAVQEMVIDATHSWVEVLRDGKASYVLDPIPINRLGQSNVKTGYAPVWSYDDHKQQIQSIWSIKPQIEHLGGTRKY